MIQLYTSGSYFGLPDPSPFVVKAMMAFKVAGIEFETKSMGFREAPKGKVPYMRDGDVLMGDTFFIMQYLAAKRSADFDKGLSARTLAEHWCLSRMLEEHFYWLIVQERWAHEENFRKGPAQFFKPAPVPIRPLIKSMIRRRVLKALHAQGLGRHTDGERLALAIGDIDAVEQLLHDQDYLGGSSPTSADVTAFPFLWSASAEFFTSAIGDEIRKRPRLVAYLDRNRRRYFPEFGG